MALNWLDLVAFVAFLATVIGVSLYASREEETSADYFLAGRNLSWWLIGFSLIASNISTEHFVGMAGRGYDIGLAIASYEWMAAVTMVIVAIFFLPKFLSSGIYTIPEYLEYRYSTAARTLMAGYVMVAYVVVALASVLYAGSLALQSIFDIDIYVGVLLIGIIAGTYTIYGGLKAVVWSDLIQGVALILGGLLVMVLGFQAVGGWDAFVAGSAGKLHTVLPWNHPEMPWVAVFIGGLWIPNLYYWGLNQFITQRTLGARNLAEGQKGIFLAAYIKLFIPFIIVFPGIMAYQLYGSDIPQADMAYPYMISRILPAGLRGIMFAALFGAVLSSLDSMLNSAATIFTIDIYKRHLKKDAPSHSLVTVGRIATAVFVVIGGLWVPVVAGFGSIFQYMQMIWGFISPGIVAAFLFGMLVKKAPPAAAIGAMILGVPVYGLLLLLLPEVAFLHHMALTFLLLIAYMAVVTWAWPLTEPVIMPVRVELDMTPSRGVNLMGAGVIVGAATLYVIFW